MSRFPRRFRRVVTGFRLVFEPIGSQDRAKSSSQEDCQSREKLDECSIVGSLVAEWLSYEDQRVQHSSDRKGKSQSKTDADEDDESCLELLIAESYFMPLLTRHRCLRICLLYIRPALCIVADYIQAFSSFHILDMGIVSSLGIHKTTAPAKDPSLVLPPVEDESLPL